MRDKKYECIKKQVESAIITCLKEDRADELHEDDNIQSTVETIFEAFWGKEV